MKTTYDNRRFTDLLDKAEIETLTAEVVNYSRPILVNFLISGYLTDLAEETEPLLTDIDFPGRISPTILDITTAILALPDSSLADLVRKVLAEI